MLKPHLKIKNWDGWEPVWVAQVLNVSKPNCIARQVALETSSLRTWFKDALQKPLTVETLKANLEDITSEGLEGLRSQGGKAHYVEAEKGDLVHVPTGWVVVEKNADVLTYGVRKSFFCASSHSLQAYALAKEVLSASSAGAGSMQKMDEIVALWKQQLQEPHG